VIQETVSQALTQPIPVDYGDCLVSITYAPTSARISNDANFENQMKYLILPD
jgi:hypothetical protein